MKVRENRIMFTSIRFPMRPLVASCGLLLSAAVMTGCSPDLASFDDTYVPASVEENFPIKVVEQPVRLALDATPAGLKPGDVDKVIRFSRQAAARGNTPVTVDYASASKTSRAAANQAAAIIARQGVARQAIIMTPHDGNTNRVVLAFSAKVAETKQCGDWSQNLRANQFNDSGPNFGCSIQHNFAAMVTNPEDFERPRTSTPSPVNSKIPALTAYDKGTWTEQVAEPIFSVGE